MIRHVYRVPTCTGIYVHVRTLGIMDGLINLHVLLAALGIYYVNENKSLLICYVKIYKVNCYYM